MYRLLVISLLVLLLLNQKVDAQGDLAGIREQVRTPDPSHDSSPPSRDSSWYCEDEDDRTLSDMFLQEVVGPAFLYTVSSPFWIPHIILEDEEDPEWVTFTPAPYAWDHGGYLLVDHFVADPENSFEDHLWAGRLSMDYATDFSSLQRIGGRALYDTSSRFGTDIEWNHWLESDGAINDSLWTGDANLIYRFAQSEQLQFRAGLGVNWMADEIGTEAGFNFTYGVDIFPCEPWIIESTIDWGKLGSADLFHSRTTVGVIYEHLELLAGFDYFDIDHISLETMIFGVRVWY